MAMVDVAKFTQPKGVNLAAGSAKKLTKQGAKLWSHTFTVHQQAVVCIVPLRHKRWTLRHDELHIRQPPRSHLRHDLGTCRISAASQRRRDSEFLSDCAPGQ